jgi:hypothetical protein
MAMYAKVRRMRRRDGLSISEITREGPYGVSLRKGLLHDETPDACRWRRRRAPRDVDYSWENLVDRVHRVGLTILAFARTIPLGD